MDTPLDDELRSALAERRGEWRAIADRAGISYSWVGQFARGKIPNPGYATLRKLKANLGPVPGVSAFGGLDTSEAGQQSGHNTRVVA